MAISELGARLEALILASEEPVKPDRLGEILGLDKAGIEGALAALAEEYRETGRGFRLERVGGGYQFRSCPEHAELIRQLRKSRPLRFTRPALETLAIIAYRQPITRAEVEYLRGVDSGGVIKTLLERRLIRILGKKDVAGKPLIYGTTREFLSLFGLHDLAALPTLKEFSELSAEALAAEEEASEPEGGMSEDAGGELAP